MKGRILIIEDEAQVLSTFTEVVEEDGYQASAASTLTEGLKLAEEGFDIVLLDLNLPDGNGLSVVDKLSGMPGSPEVLVITGLGSPASAGKALSSGAWNFIEKPPSIKELKASIAQAMEYRQSRRPSAAVNFDRRGIVGQSPALLASLERLAQAAPTMANVLLQGEMGTGKALAARAIHANSPQRNGPFVVSDCASLDDQQTEATLFGTEPGAGREQQPGLLALAAGGTLFLDCVDSLSPAMQTKLLRVLQDHRFRPVGARTEVQCDFRLVSATSRNLEDMVRSDEFRQDLLLRLNVIPVTMPPLRQRREDIPLLAREMADTLSRRNFIPAKELSSDFLDALAKYDWPGNVRELENTLEQALVLGMDSPVLFAKHLPEQLRVAALYGRETATRESQPWEALPHLSPDAPPGAKASVPSWQELKDGPMAELEKKYLADLLARSGGNVRKAATKANLGLSRFYELLKRHGLKAR